MTKKVLPQEVGPETLAVKGCWNTKSCCDGGGGRSGGGGGHSDYGGGGGGAATCRSLNPCKVCICRFNASFLEKEPSQREQRNIFTLCCPEHE